MSQRRYSYPRNEGSSMLDSSSPSQHLLLQLKQQIISGLGKLNDRDTQLSGVKDLERLAIEMPPEALVLYVSCLCDKDKDSHQRSSARKETVKLFGVLARSHPEAIVLHINRIVAALVRRFRDPDSGMPEACAETFGIMASHVDLMPSGLEGTTDGETVEDNIATVFLKPLLDALNVQAKSVQVAAIMCFERVVLSCREPLDGQLSRLVPRFTNHLTRPTFLAKGHLATAIATLTEVSGDVMGQHLPHLLPLLCDALDNLDWSTRKNTAEALGRLVGCLNADLLTPFKPAVLQGLDSCRSDRVKPVRESASAAILRWRDVPGSDIPKKTTPPPKPGLPDRLSRTSLSEGGKRGASPALTSRRSTGTDPGTGSMHNRTSSDHTPRRALDYEGAMAATSSRSGKVNGQPKVLMKVDKPTSRTLPAVGGGKERSEPKAPRRHSFGNMFKDNPLFHKRATSSEWHIEIAVPGEQRTVTTLPDVAPVEEVVEERAQQEAVGQEASEGVTGWASMVGGFVKPQKEVEEEEGVREGHAVQEGGSVSSAPPNIDILDVDSERQQQEQGIGSRSMPSPAARQRQRSTWQASSRGGVFGVGADERGLFGSRVVYESGGEESELERVRHSRPLTGGSEGRSEWSLPRVGKTGGIPHMAEESGSEMDEVGWGRRGMVMPSRYDAASGISGLDGSPGVIGQQLGRVEQQQARMLDMMQAFIASSQDSMEGVEIRLKSLERSMEHLTRPLNMHPSPLAYNYTPMDQSTTGDGGRRESWGLPPPSPGSARGWQSPRWADPLLPKAEEGSKWGSRGRLSSLSWSSMSELLRGGRLGEAYDVTVQQGDLPLLLKLMMKTGPVLPELGQETAEKMTLALVDLMATPQHVEYVLPWMRQLTEMECGPGGGGPALTRGMKEKTVEMLRAAEGEGRGKWTGKVAGQLAAQLATAWQRSAVEEG